MKIPIYIPCFNNGWLVENTIDQLDRFGQEFIVIDNASDSSRTRNVLARLEKRRRCRVVRMRRNHGHRVLWRKDIYPSVPEYFAVTDPDLGYPRSLPEDFLEVLAALTDELQFCKAGLALEIPGEEETYPGIYRDGKAIREWETQFWQSKIDHPRLEIYEAPIDTTFAVYNKKYENWRCCRAAGPFTARHLPWYIPHNCGVPAIDVLETYGTAHCSTFATVIMEDYRERFPHLRLVSKNQCQMVVEFDGSDAREGFWKNHYSRWERETFEVFDRYSREDQTAVDVGSWIGPTALYLGQKCRRVLSVEADEHAAAMLRRNIEHSGLGGRVEVIEKALYADNGGAHFGSNFFRPKDGLDASASQIVLGSERQDARNRLVPSISWGEFAALYLKDEPVCLVQVDIEGGEEFILGDLLRWAHARRVPAYVSFHYDWWRSRDLDRFREVFKLFGMPHLKERIEANPFISIVFEREKSPLLRWLEKSEPDGRQIHFWRKVERSLRKRRKRVLHKLQEKANR
jgi:FkbM family methyltransferase